MPQPPQDWEEEVKEILAPAELVPDLQAQIVNQFIDQFTTLTQAHAIEVAELKAKIREEINKLDKNIINLNPRFPTGNQYAAYKRAVDDIINLPILK
jgi:hypothetical protein